MAGDSGQKGPGTDLEALARADLSRGRASPRLLSAVRPLICRWALMQTGDGDVAEDLAQEVLIRLSRSFSRFRGESRFTTWLYRVVANAARDRARKLDREERGRERAWEFSGTRSSLDSPGAEEVQRLLQVILRELSPNQRAAFDLVDLQGFSGPQAAAMQKMNESTFRVHLARARAAVREAIAAGSAK